MALVLSEEPLALVQAAHEDPEIDKLSKAFEAPTYLFLEYLETQLWIAKYVRPDQSYLVPKNTGPAGFSASNSFDFTWGFGPIEIDISVDRLSYYIRATVFVVLPFIGKKKLVSVEGSLKDGVEGSFDLVFAKGSVRFYLKNGTEVWVQLKLSGPLCPTIDSDYYLFKLFVKEIQQLRADPPEGIRVVPSEENMLDVVGIVAGPEGTPYAGGYFHIHFSFPATFPAAPPSARMLTKIFHPNVSRSGEICVNTLKKDWKPTYGLAHVLVTIKCLLIVPNAESALDEEAGKLLLEDWDGFCARAKMWCSVHATPKVPPVEFQTADKDAPENAPEPASPKSKLVTVQQSPLQPSAVGNAAEVPTEPVPQVKPPISAPGTENGAVVKTTAKRVATGGVEKKKKALKRL